jgi:glycosyltransferase involved in cell wall biosynthesis
MNKKRLIVCDYDNPNKYTFPNFDMGSSEKRLWHFAKTASEIPGIEVVITGPLWLPQYVPLAKYFPKRLNQETVDEFIKKFGQFDYLFAGHEYFDKDEWIIPFKKSARSLISYQLHPYEYKKSSFNGKDKLLFCYSDEMMRLYTDQKPIKALLFHSGVSEEPKFYEKPSSYVLWFGRIDRDKAFDIALKTSEFLSMPLVVMGKSVKDQVYLEKLKEEYDMSNVKFIGFKSGREKMEIIAKAACILYTVADYFREAGAGIFGEALSSGVPVVGMSWTGDDAVATAITSNNFGRIVKINQQTNEQISIQLNRSIEECLKFDRKIIRDYGISTYNPTLLVKKILDIADERYKI